MNWPWRRRDPASANPKAKEALDSALQDWPRVSELAARAKRVRGADSIWVSGVIAVIHHKGERGR